MSALLNRIRAAGVELKADGDRLLIRGTPTAKQRAWLASHKPKVLAELRTPMRPVVEYRFPDDPTWHVMLGSEDDTYESAVAVCHRQFGAVLTRERDTLPDGFPFKRHGDDGEWKRKDGTDL
jgi:hypothetical protein